MATSQSRGDTLKTSLAGSGTAPRPVLTSLNGDNSWLFSFPRPAADRKVSHKAYFHVVSDVWLQGPAVADSTWYSWALQFELPEKPAVQDGHGVLEIVAEIEDAAAAAGLIVRDGTATPASVDAIFLNAIADDHVHEASLRTFEPDVPVFAVSAAAAFVRTWKYFSQVHEYHDLDPSSPDWRALHPGPPLPPWLTVFRLDAGHPVLFATAIVYSTEPGAHEAILWSPHGIAREQPALKAFLTKMEPPIPVRCVMHALHENYFLWMFRQTTGADGGLALVRQAKPKYWVQTHRQLLKTTGWFGRLMRDYPRTLESALEKGKSKDENNTTPTPVEVPNGGSFVLE